MKYCIRSFVKNIKEILMRTIPIAPVASEFSDCEESGIVPKQNLPLARREFLKGSGILMGTLAAGSVLAGLAPSTVWAVELKTLSKAEGETLMAMGRVLYPHKKLPNAVYAILAKDLDGSASGDAGAASMLREGISNLNALAGGNFAKAKADKQLAIVKGMEGSGVLRCRAWSVREFALQQRHGICSLWFPRLCVGKRRLHHPRFPRP
jgi:hypothetical protein